ncbi:MAG: carboxypeptidase-like regulatory domain-containing protein [Candidatus Zixiibacteriota bacterium]
MKPLIGIAAAIVPTLLSGCVFHSRAPHTAILTGRIVDCRTGEPIFGASVLLVGTTIGAMSQSDGSFVVPKIQPGTYDCAFSSVSYEKMQIQRVAIMRGVVSCGDVALLHSDPVGLIASIDTADTVPPLVADLYNRRLFTYEDSLIRRAEGQKLFDEVAAVHLRNLQFLLTGEADSLASNLDSIYADLVEGSRVRYDTARITQFRGLFKSRSYSRLRGVAMANLVDFSTPDYYLVTKYTRWNHLKLGASYALGLLRQGDVIVAFRSKDPELLPFGWIGAYRFIERRWIMVAAALPCRC